MPDETQPKIGTPREVSTNDAHKTGRPLVTETQDKIGTPRDVSTNDTSRGGSPVEPTVNRGYGQAPQDPQPPEPRRVDDKVKSAGGGD
jgi:hypothetical protein